LSTGLNSLSCVVIEDFVKVFIQRKLSSLEIQLWMRGVVIVFGILSVAGILIIQQIDGVMQLAMSISSCTLGPLLGVFSLGIFMPWINSKSAFVGGISSFIGMLAIGVNTQLAIMRKEVVYQPKPVYVNNCSYTWTGNSTESHNIDYYTSGHHLSYIYYGFFGVVSCCLIGNLFSLMFGKNDIKQMNPLLVAPFIRKMLIKSQK
jgi:solute carrier family 5 (sodium-coupled monocarboxylate transporter), member 8/12